MKDNFSHASGDYAKFRPTYPQELLLFLRNRLSHTGAAWDCATGNGQVAGELAGFFDRVAATDISREQLKNAVKKPNITYSLQPAEKTDFPDNSFDLISVGQAVHWFDFEKFYKEAKRVLKPNGLIAVIGYSLFKSNPETEAVILHFYKNIIDKYWDPERRYLDEHYKTIPFPFQEVETPEFQQKYTWNFKQLEGYLKTWSAVKHYEKQQGENPVDLILPDLKSAFGREGEVIFPILFRLGQVV